MEVWIVLVVGMPALSGQPVTIIGKGQRKHSFISAIDVAKFMIASINNLEAINQKLVIGGPEALSLRDASAIFEQKLNHSIPIRSVAPGQSVPSLPESMTGFTCVFLDFFDSPIDMKEITNSFGINLTSMTNFAETSSKTARNNLQ